MLIAARLAARRTPWIADRCGGWTAATPIARCVFLALGAFAAGLTATIFSLVHAPEYLLTTGLILVAAAEWLIVKRRLFGAGIEEALEVAGLLMIALQVIDPIADSTAVRAPLLIATALAVAGFRLLNPFFIALSVAALSFALESLGTRHGNAPLLPSFIAMAFCFAMASAALIIGRTQFHRPSYDQMLNWLVITMPLAGYLWAESKNASGLTFELLREAPMRSIPVVILAGFGISALKVGIRRRVHAPIIAFLICAACVGYELRHLSTLPIQWKLIGWGSGVLLLALALDRYLSTPRRGITSKQFDEDGSLDLLQLAGASVIAPPGVQPPGAQFKGGGGAGGGGGASQSY